MSTISRAHRIQLTLAAATLVVSLFGGIASAFAQSNGGGGGNGNDGNSGGNSAVLLFGTAGNCPPTIACGGQPSRRIVRERQDNCSEWVDDPRLYHRCMMRRR